MAHYVESLGEQYERELAQDSRCAKAGARCAFAWIRKAFEPMKLSKHELKERALLMEKGRALLMEKGRAEKVASTDEASGRNTATTTAEGAGGAAEATGFGDSFLTHLEKDSGLPAEATSSAPAPQATGHTPTLAPTPLPARMVAPPPPTMKSAEGGRGTAVKHYGIMIALALAAWVMVVAYRRLRCRTRRPTRTEDHVALPAAVDVGGRGGRDFAELPPLAEAEAEAEAVAMAVAVSSAANEAATPATSPTPNGESDDWTTVAKGRRGTTKRAKQPPSASRSNPSSTAEPEGRLARPAAGPASATQRSARRPRLPASARGKAGPNVKAGGRRGPASNKESDDRLGPPRPYVPPSRTSSGGLPGTWNAALGAHGLGGSGRAVVGTFSSSKATVQPNTGNAPPRVGGERNETARQASTGRRLGVFGSGGRERNGSAALNKAVPKQEPKSVRPASMHLENRERDNLCGVHAVSRLVRHNKRLCAALGACVQTPKGDLAHDQVMTMNRDCRAHPEAVRAVYDGSFMRAQFRNGHHQDAHEVFLKIVGVLSGASEGDSVGAAKLQQAVKEMTLEVASQRTCSCGFESTVRKEAEHILTVPVGYEAERIGTPTLRSLLQAKFVTRGLDACHHCQGLAEVKAREGDLLARASGLEDAALGAVIAAANECDARQLPCFFLEKAYESLQPFLGSPSCALRETVHSAFNRLQDTLKSRAEKDGFDEAAAMLLQASLRIANAAQGKGAAQRAESGSPDPIKPAVNELESLGNTARAALAGRIEGNEDVLRSEQTERSWLENSPETVYVYLMRFAHGGGDTGVRMLGHKIGIPSVLDMAAYNGKPTPKKGQKATTYALDGVLHHRGATVNGGHYVAYVRDSSQWSCYDDRGKAESVVHESEALSGNALMLSYTRQSR